MGVKDISIKEEGEAEIMQETLTLPSKMGFLLILFKFAITSDELF